MRCVIAWSLGVAALLAGTDGNNRTASIHSFIALMRRSRCRWLSAKTRTHEAEIWRHRYLSCGWDAVCRMWQVSAAGRQQKPHHQQWVIFTAECLPHRRRLSNLSNKFSSANRSSSSHCLPEKGCTKFPAISHPSLKLQPRYCSYQPTH